jgi:hypothetical protein
MNQQKQRLLVVLQLTVVMLGLLFASRLNVIFSSENNGPGRVRLLLLNMLFQFKQEGAAWANGKKKEAMKRNGTTRDKRNGVMVVMVILYHIEYAMTVFCCFKFQIFQIFSVSYVYNKSEVSETRSSKAVLCQHADLRLSQAHPSPFYEPPSFFAVILHG